MLKNQYIKGAAFFLLFFLHCVLLAGCGNADAFSYAQPPAGEPLAEASEENAESSVSGETRAAGNRSAKERGTEGADASRREAEPLAGASEKSAESSAPEEIGAEEKQIYVQVCGAVAEPGVYALDKDARVFEAIQLAGGFAADAAADAVNQASRLADGDMIRIPTNTEWEGQEPDFGIISEKVSSETKADSGSGTSAPVDLNTADLSALKTLPGIGQTLAERIVEYRGSHGAFQSIEEIKNVTGIKDGLFQKIKDKIRV